MKRVAAGDEAGGGLKRVKVEPCEGAPLGARVRLGDIFGALFAPTAAVKLEPAAAVKTEARADPPAAVGVKVEPEAAVAAAAAPPRDAVAAVKPEPAAAAVVVKREEAGGAFPLHPCLVQYGGCPFVTCQWRAMDGRLCVRHLHGRCNTPQCVYIHAAAAPAGGGPAPAGRADEQMQGNLRSLVWCGRRNDAAAHAHPWTDYMVARDVAASGAKQFALAPAGLAANLVLGTPPRLRHYYVVVPPTAPVDMYFDIDVALPQAPRLPAEAVAAKQQEVLTGVLGTLVAALEPRAAAAHATVAPAEASVTAPAPAAPPGAPALDRLLVLDATTAKKISFHIHASLAEHVFATAQALKAFVADAFPPAHPCHPHVDASVYSTFACYRLPYSSKMGKDAAFVPFPLRDAGGALAALAARYELPCRSRPAARTEAGGDGGAHDVLQFCRVTQEGTAKHLITHWKGQGGGGGAPAPAAPALPAVPTARIEGMHTAAPPLPRDALLALAGGKGGKSDAARETQFVWKAAEDTPAAKEGCGGAVAEWAGRRAWCGRRGGAEKERSPLRNFLAARTPAAAAAAAAEYLQVPAHAVPHLAVGDEAHRYYSVVLDAKQPVDFFLAVSTLLPRAGRGAAGGEDAATALGGVSDFAPRTAPTLRVDGIGPTPKEAAARAAQRGAASRVLSGVLRAVLTGCDARGVAPARLLVLWKPWEGCGGADCGVDLRVHVRLADGAAFEDLAAMEACAVGMVGDWGRVGRVDGGGGALLPLPWSGGAPLRPYDVLGDAALMAALPYGADAMQKLCRKYHGTQGFDVEDVCLMASAVRPDALPTHVVTAAGAVRPYLSAPAGPPAPRPAAPGMLVSTPLGAVAPAPPPNDAVRAALLLVIQCLAPEYASVGASGFTHSVAGDDRRAYSVKLTASRHCLLLGRPHKGTHPSLLVREGAVYLRCWSNDCSGSGTVRLAWPPGAASARACLFP